MAERLVVNVHGRVQMVFFRRSAQLRARILGLTGWARNEDDGSVTVVVEGGEDPLRRFLAWCESGPPSANVTGIRHEWQDATGEFKRFEIQ